MRARSIASLVLIFAPVPALAADALDTLDTFNFQSAIIRKCHPTQDADMRAFMAKGDALREAALVELASEYDAVNPTHERENRVRASRELGEKAAARDFDVDEQIRNYGCDWLDGRVFSYQTKAAPLGREMTKP